MLSLFRISGSLLFVYLLPVAVGMHAQNLVPNPSFETHTSCPVTFGQLSLATPWNTATAASPDYFNACDPADYVSVPINFAGTQTALTGEAYAGLVFAFSIPDSYREYIIAPLTQPLVAGVQYEVGFYLSLGETYNCATTEFGAYFSAAPPAYPTGYNGVLNLNPQFKPEPGFVFNQIGWTLLQGCFTAAGGEQYITIGNFSAVGDTPFAPGCEQFPGAYYFIEDVYVQLGSESTTIDFELGDPVLACDQYTIDPELDNVNYYWSDGSQGSTLTVTESGTYVLTVTNSCMTGVDSVEVEIIGAPDVQLGPPDIDLCSTTPFLFSLNNAYDYVWQDGSTAAEYWVTETGLYSVTMDDGCDETTDEIFITIYDPVPPISLAGNDVLCPGEVINFEFDPSLGDFEWQDGSGESNYSIDQPGFYSVTISNICGTGSASVTITALDEPQVDLGPDSVGLCTGEIYDIELPFDPGTHQFIWQDGGNDSNISLEESGIYSVTVTNECGSGTAVIELYFGYAPVVELEDDMLLCNQSDYIIDAGNADAMYIWQDGTTGSTYAVTESGTYSVTASNACGSESDQIDIVFADSLIPPDLGPDLTLCQQQQLILQVDYPGALVTWQDGSVQDSFIVQQTGSYHVTISNACNSVSDTMVVQYNQQAPDVTLPDTLNLCQGDSLTLDANVSGVTYVWNDGSTFSTLEVFVPGLYSVTISNLCGADSDTITVADGGPAPTVELGDEIGLCPGDTLDLVPAYSNVDTWLWSNGATTASTSIVTSGSISVIAGNGCGTRYDTIHATLLPATPAFSLGNDTAVCEKEIVTLSVNVPDVNITWSDGSTHADLAVSTAGQYFATISNACGSFADTISISQLPPIPPLDLGDDQSLCPGELFVIDPGILDVDYLWHDGSTNSTFSTTQPGAITLTISNACGSTTDELIITESTEGPQIDLGPDITGCVGESIAIQSGISGVDYLWQDGSTNSSFIANVSGQVILYVSNNCGMDADTLFVELSGLPPVVELGADTLLCDNATLDLSVTHEPGTVITWQDGSTSETFEVIQPGQYAVSAMNACGEANDVIVVDYAFSPQPFSLGPDTALCVGESLLLTAPVTTDIIQWQDGSSAPAFIADQSQVYALQISNQCGVVSDELQLTLIDETFSIELDTAMAWCPGQVIEVDVQQPFVAMYLWSTGATTPVISITEPGSYAISIQTHCASADDVFEVVLDDACFPKTTYYIPNIFSPNGDGINDVFTVRFNADAAILSMQGAIYDRWGNLLFASTDNPFTWDGKRNGQVMNPAVFVYDFQFTFLRNGSPVIEKVTGDITLMK